ncbi:MAG TPA: L,D-transpeptidase family protein [Kiritimatiellia bacterium]
MTDIFVNRDPSPSKGRIVFIGIAVAVVIGLGTWAFLNVIPKLSTDAAAAPEAASTASTDAAPAPAFALNSALPAPGSDPVSALLEEARKLKEADDYETAREKASAALEQTANESARAAARDVLGDVDMGLLFSERPMPEKTDYTVQSGDSIAKLANKFGTTLELISKGNDLKGSNIRIGDRLRIFSGKFSVKVDKTDNILDLYLNDKFFKRYQVGTGQYSKTPVGTFKITDRVAQPTWWRDDGKAIPYGDPENLLGTHWLSLDIRGYGIHGTWQPETIGKQSSAGCIRLLNEDVEQLYTVLPIGTPVTIED